uniref:Immunoglobulin domain-containing protein n=1 Tax=Cyprinus carpio TaxID=7962 RepID=A0A8C1ZPZ3_CYPCA
MTCNMSNIFLSFFFFFLLESFSVPASSVEGFVGGSVLLPCFIHHSELQDRIKDVNVHWRYNNSKIVIDIIGGNRTAEDQAPEYNNRVEMFPDEYKKGNFCLKINNIKKTHAGKYTCIITGPFQNEKHTELCVKDKPEEKGNIRKSVYVLLIVFVFVILIFVIIIYASRQCLLLTIIQIWTHFSFLSYST